MTQLRLRIDFGPAKTRSLGPGKIELLERIDEYGSIAAAARSMGMAYRRAWLLIDSMNHCFRTPVVRTRKGGKAQGGAYLTPFGEMLINRYRAMEAKTQVVLAPHIQALERELADTAPPQEITPPPADEPDSA